MADGLLTSILGAIDRQKQATKAGLGLLVSNPMEFARSATARYFPTPEEVAQQRALEQSGGVAMNTPYMDKMFNLAQFQGSIKPTGLLQSAKPMTVYRAGAEEGMTAKSGGPTFYSLNETGTKPFEKGGYKTKEYNISPNKIIDASRGEGIKIYKDFLKETNNPAGYGNTHRPYWTAENDFREWLNSKNIKFDAIMFDEPTGIPSIAIYKK